MQSEWMKVVTNRTLNIATDTTLQELSNHGSEAFPFQWYKEQLEWNHSVSVDWHWHEEIELVIVTGGAMDCLVDEQRIPLKQGQGILLNSRTIHGLARSETYAEHFCAFQAILFRSSMIGMVGSAIYEKYVQPVIYSGVDHIVLNQSNPWNCRIFEWVKQMEQECKVENALTEMKIHMGLCEIWMELYSHLEEYQIQEKHSKNIVIQTRLRKMMNYVWEHYQEPITANDIAKAAEISQSAALRCFQSGVQMTPIEYLNDYRMHCAKEKLLTTQESITDIALSVGFEHPSYFTRVFKKYFGITPTEFLKNHQAKQQKMQK